MAIIKKPSVKTFLLLLVIIALVVSAGAAYYYYSKYEQTLKLLQNPSSAAQEEVNSIVKKVGEIMDLPSDESPTIATISDVSKLKNQPFFAHAKNGFKVLLYQKAKKAILYDPFMNRIIDVQPLSIGNTTAQTQTIKIALMNGTAVAGAASKVETQITAAYPGASIVSKTDAKGSYSKTIVVALSDSANTNVTALASVLKATVGNLPTGEDKPAGADILIIIGTDLVK